MRYVHATEALRLIEGNSLELLGSEFKPESFDSIIVDPAYWTQDKHRAVGTTTRLGGGYHSRNADPESTGWFKTINEQELKFCLEEFARLLKPNAHCWIMCDGIVQSYIMQFAIAAQNEPKDSFPANPLRAFNYCKPYPVLKKASTGNLKLGTGYHFKTAHEFVVLLEKGRRPFADNNRADVFGLDFIWQGGKESARFTPDKKPYPTAKPVAFYRQLIEQSTAEGELILDCFAGSGACGEAARELRRNVVLIDRSRRAIETITNRLINSGGGLFG